MVLVGHSQGGLLVKMAAIDTGPHLWDGISREPLDQLKLKPETRELLRQSLFLKPEPFVGRVIFIATPHRGSYLAEYSIRNLIQRLVRLPLTLVQARATFRPTIRTRSSSTRSARTSAASTA